ncbi:DEAD/DEAH box helicase [Streptomyces sp. NPDC023723]|uniref:DEAD/DEAH box helicase n=1 Tax=Streptomyces sp. NPDC023723 TaxID=3154323 RepID=UPI0033C82D90
MALSGTDVIGQAKTGTGKTLGFGLPLLERVTVPADVEAGRAAPEALTDTPQALVVVPTRELCQQVTNDLLTAGKVRNVRVTAIYGGRAYEPQVEALKKGVDVIVGTPGRLLDLAGQKKLSLKHVKCLVLDEADEMLDLGFLPDVEKIINLLPAKRQTMLFSATMPGAVIGLARRYMSQPTHIRATSPDDEGQTVANTKQFIYRAHNMDKPEMVSRILQAEGRGLVMVFCRTKRTAADLADQLQQRGFASGAVHGDLGQGAREQALRAFRNGKVDVLVCTDVAARGIDVEGVTHVINYQSPEEEKTYLHRIGRTGRAGAKGTAITLVDWDDIPRWQLINKALDLGFNDPPETYSTSPHLYSDLGIPEGTKGVLPRAARTRAGLAAEELEDLGEPGGRGGRDRGRGGRGGRDESRSGGRDRAADRESSSTRTPRRRRRTRSGTPLDPAAPATEAVTAVPGDGAPEDGDTAPRTLRRRRRTRNGAQSRQPQPTTTSGSAGAEDTATAVSASEAATAVQAPVVTEAPAVVEAPAIVKAPAVVETPAVTEAPEAPEKPRRRRTRKSAETRTAPQAPAEAAPVTAEAPVITEAPVVVEAASVVETAPVTPAAPVEEAPAVKPRRRTRKAAASAETAVETAEGTAIEGTTTEGTASEAPEAETKPKARRTRKTAAATAVPAPTAEAAEPEAKPKARRTRKATTAAETAADTAEGTETKPKARRTRKTAAATAAPATAPATATDPTADIPAQTSTEPGPGPEAEAGTKPRRTRKTAAKATTTAETVADTAEGTTVTETKPRRTRKTAAAKAVPAPSTEAAEPEAKPKTRRTRKATTAAEPTAGIPAQTSTESESESESESGPEAEAGTKPRRTRKTAAKATTTAEDAAAKPKVRRTRKAAAAPQPAESPES